MNKETEEGRGAVAGQVQQPVRPHRTPTRDEVERLMKRCQVGVGGRNALDEAHSIMAECYGTLGLLMLCLEQQQAEAKALRELWDEAEAENDAMRVVNRVRLLGA